MTHIFLDIETVPMEIKDEAIKNYLMDKKISRKSRSFHPLYSKIIVIGIKELNKPIEVLYNDNENALLEMAWQILGKNPFSVIVTFNGYKFDIPFLIIRSCINSIKLPIQINTNRWAMERSNHFDVMLFFSQYETFLNSSPEVIGRFLNIDNLEKNSITGADIERIYNEGKIEEIKRKCENDIELLEAIFKKGCLSYIEAKKFS